MKILHTADIHLGDLSGPTVQGKNARRQDTIDCMSAIARTAETEKPQLTVIAGDLFNRSRVWADTALEDIADAVDQFIRPLCEHSEHVAVLFGTENHDNPRAFEVLKLSTKDLGNLHIYTEPDVYRLDTTEGSIQILALPGYDKGRLRAFMPDADKETENRNATALINDVLLGLGTKLNDTIPSVLLAHYTVAGSETESGSTFLAGQDVVILPQTIDTTGVTLACLGHIHKRQRLECKTPAYYSGSPNQMTFGDEGGEQGFFVHTITQFVVHGTQKKWGVLNSEFNRTPAREHLTLRFEESDTAHFIQTGKLPDHFSALDLLLNKIIRIRYTATPEQEKALNKAALQKELQGWGAFHVAEIIPESTELVASSADMESDDTPTAAMLRYFDMAGMETDNAKRLAELAAPLIQKADDGRDLGKHTGAFIPRRIELKNYRSYTAAEFDLEAVKMAMVNGQNGVGKSSLFMDAIADALFEESRDGQLGGWLREGEKSGAVTFEFGMGGEEYRVTRTRTKSGKGTLAFNRKDDKGEWTDAGDTTMKLTQAKIEQTLGMDSQTFCSIALIRQDAYGLFLEADSDRRMEVLSALLNLGIYVRLETMAKDEATIQRRAIAQTKDRMNVLADQIAEKESLDQQDRELEDKLTEMSLTLADTTRQIESAQKAETLREELQKQATRALEESQTLEREAREKAENIHSLVAERNSAAEMSAKLSKAEQANIEVTRARGVLEILPTDEKDLGNAETRRIDIIAKISDSETMHKTIKEDIDSHQAIIIRRDEIEKAAKELEQINKERAELDAQGETYAKALNRHNETKAAVQGLIAESKVRIGAISEQIKAAESKTALLEDSGCPIPGDATCAFLKDAKEAETQLATLRKSLKETQNADRAEYEKLNKELETAAKALETMPDPQKEREKLAKQENQIIHSATLKPKLDMAAAMIEQYEKQSQTLLDEIEVLKTELHETVKQLPELQKNAGLAATNRQIIKDNESLANQLAECTAAFAKVTALGERITAAQQDVEVLEEKASQARILAENTQSKVPPPNTDLANLTNRHEELQANERKLLSERGGIKTRLETISSAVEQHNEYADEVKKLAQSLTDYQTLSQTFGIDGIQYMIIRSVVPEIMQRSNDILAAMTGGRMAVDFRTEKEQKSSAKIVNSLDVWITSLTGGSRPYSSHSGGEKVKIALAVTLGLADIKARRAGVQLGMLFIDEPPFLDADGTEAYADALTSMAARNPDMRILAISHDPTMKARFEQNITVLAGENGSEVTIEL